MGDSVLAALSRKLGIASNDVIRKAAEFQRIVEVRCGSSLASLNLSNTATAVICLEFAANASGLSFTKTTAIQLSGLTKKLYINAYKAIECILGKQKMVTLRDFAVMFGCVSSVPFAEEVLGSYKSTQNGAVDLDQPVFAAATLYVVCRSKKVRLDKSKLITQINVKRSIFDNVCKQIQPFLDNVTENSKVKDSKRPYGWLEESVKKSSGDGPGTKRTRISEDERKQQEVADYESWKLKMLNETAENDKDST
ncbi:origin recognition complex subunit 6-like [Dendronephthya gigantea]|uniref:origin recognition complex subunit 6-like n=1 Tax=Dendronephthya gigantea TaxID=151771 RepID=UPI0010694BC6|nr:origin recognition complex subunit 6-like [Dendronephthya gigantea]